MKIEVDADSKSAYIRMKTGKVAKTVTVSEKSPLTNIDYDNEGEVVGIEFVGLKSKHLRGMALMR